MTRNNLDQHLAWLLQTKASLPSGDTTLPEVQLSFTAAIADAGLPSQDNVEAAQPLNNTIRSSTVSEVPVAADMARLRTAPGSASRPNLISIGPRLSDDAARRNLHTPDAARPISSAYSTAQSTFIQTPIRSLPGTPKAHRDVDVMDLTESMNQMASPSGRRGRKRKSSELDADAAGPPRNRAARNVCQQAPIGQLPTASQQSFTAIDEIMDETIEPPPPYSTIAPKPASSESSPESSSTLGPLRRSEMDEFAVNDDGRLVNFSGKTTNPAPSLKKTAPVATPNFAGQSTASTLFSDFLTLSNSQINELIETVKAHHETLVEAVFHLLEADEDDSGLQEDLKRSSEKCEALAFLSSKRGDYKALLEEKELTAAALKQAIRTQQGLESAKAANSAVKVKLQQLEAECMNCFRTCQKDIETHLATLRRSDPSEGTKRVAVHSTQGVAPPHAAVEVSVSSSSRVAQTQVPKPDKSPLRPLEQEFRDVSSDPSNIGAYFSPSKKRAADYSSIPKQVRSPCGKKYSSNLVDNRARNLEYEDNEPAMFSNRMGTPPVPFFDQNEDDFGLDDDDGMLELVEDVENRGMTRASTRTATDRAVFAELPSNSLRTAANTSSKKMKRPLAKAEDPNMEELFRFPWSSDVKKTLKERFRLKGFRENQLQAINATLGGKDTFVLMPTGGGKSLCYQLPSLILSGKTTGVTVVISPLLSLMEDQVQHLRSLQIQAFLINGQTKGPEKNAIFQALNEADVEKFVQLLYITPEMLAKSSNLMFKLERLYHRQKLARLVIDEAHCVSQWGHDFRPDYKEIGDVRRKFPEVPVMALTATATENVKVDTIHNLGIVGCEVYTQSFNRANLYYEVREKANGKSDTQNIASLIREKHHKQTGIIYCFSKQNCEVLAKALKEEFRIEARHYHAALDPEKKSEVQKDWQAGRIHVIVATIAFGMGIDKPNVRFVIHHTIPKSLEGYYQETGRAGRDQKPSVCYLFYAYKDAGKIRRMIDDGEGSWEQIQRQRLMFQNMIQYCENRSDCRRVQVLRYFGEKFHRDQCRGQCDNCNSTSTFEKMDFTSYAQQAVSLVKSLAGHNVTVQHCIEIFCGSKTKKVTEQGHDELEEYGAGRDLDRENVERLFSRLLSEDALIEIQVMNKAGFAHTYVEPGRKNERFNPWKTKLEMEVRTTPRAKQAPSKIAPKAKSKKASKVDHTAEQKRKMKKTAVGMTFDEYHYGDNVQYPMSTNVSSPIQAIPKRKKAKNPSRNDVHGNGYYRDDFVISDPEDGDYADADDDSSDGFEPVRIQDQDKPSRSRTPGPPIRTDRVMDDLDDTHRDLVGNFVITAREMAKKIALNKSCPIPFTDTILRAMAINFTETEEDMLAIPGINPERVRLYGKQFCKEVTKCREFYEEMLADRPDPNARNVIDLVSDDEDDYGSIGSSDLEGEEEEGESSEYFQPTKAVVDFNARFAESQSAAMRSSASRQPAAKGPPKGKKRYRATASAGTANGGRNARGPRRTSKSYDGYAGAPGAASKKPAAKRQGGAGNQQGGFVSRGRRVGGQSGGGGGGFRAMPTG